MPSGELPHPTISASLRAGCPLGTVASEQVSVSGPVSRRPVGPPGPGVEWNSTPAPPVITTTDVPGYQSVPLGADSTPARKKVTAEERIGTFLWAGEKSSGISAIRKGAFCSSAHEKV